MISPLVVLLVAVAILCLVALTLGRRAGGMSRSVVVILGIVAVGWQFVVGAGSSLQLAAAGVGDRALWVPNALVGVSRTFLPIGFVLCLWGTRLGRGLASVCAVVSVIAAAAAAATLSVPPVELVGLAIAFVLFAAPGVVLLVCAQGIRVGSTMAEDGSLS